MTADTRIKCFSYDDRDLEVKARIADRRWVVHLFEKGHRANQVEYTVTLETAYDAAIQNGWDLVGGLMDLAERDFIYWSNWNKRNASSPSN